jgi:hypothetical protein
MNRDDVIRMAREAWDRDTDPWLTYEQLFLERFAALVAAAEREAIIKATIDQGFVARALVLAEREKCAQLVETYQKAGNTMGAPEYVMVFKDCAAAIRARSNP